jgi:hypothetical protein
MTTSLHTSCRHPLVCYTMPKRKLSILYDGIGTRNVLYCTSTCEVEVRLIVPSRLHQMCLPQDNLRACPPPRHPSTELFPADNPGLEHQPQTQPSLCITRAISTISRASILHLHPNTSQYHHQQQQVIRHALSRLGRHPLSQGLPGAVQGVQDDLLCRAGWQWRRVRRRQWYVRAF